MGNQFIYVILISALIDYCVCFDNVIGCGGFIKSHAPIDFSKIEIKLLTKQGSLKESAFCAPTNGYYFLPVYDKGDYILKINPPTGWSFKPEEIHMSIDGVKDDCSKGTDINFVFRGFGITGQVVNIHSTTGPAGVKIKLNDGKEIKETVTSADGSFYFTPVYPGSYEITASHPEWKFVNNHVTVTVKTSNTEIPKDSFVIKGYSVKGRALIQGQPLEKVYIALFSQNKQKENVEECDRNLLADFPDSKNKICHVISDVNGKFNFPSVSIGKYYIRPFHKINNIIYHIEPKEISFEVVDNNVELPPFDVNSFTIEARVLSSPKGKVIPGAKIKNNLFTAETKSDGSFLLENIKSGIYDIEVNADAYEFETQKIVIDPIKQKVFELYPSKFRVCGNIGTKTAHNVLFQNMNNEIEDEEVRTDDNGEFCYYLKPGDWKASVEVTESDRNSGIQFFPVEQPLTITDQPKNEVLFSQLKAKVVGKVKCIRPIDCNKLKVILTLMASKGKNIEYSVSLDDNNEYVVSEVIPGTYNVTLDPNKFCWQTNQQNITINTAKTVVPDFIQTGYQTTFDASHNMKIGYVTVNKDLKTNKDVNTQNFLDIHPGLNTFCFNESRKYEFNLQGCHIFKQNTIIHDIDTNDNTIKIEAIKHRIVAAIKTLNEYKNFKVKIVRKDEKIEGPLPYEKKKDGYYYKLELYLTPNEVAQIYPLEDSLWYEPPHAVITGEDDCKDVGKILTGHVGKIIKGEVVPAISDVDVIVKREDGVIYKTKTDENGQYKFPALNAGYLYTITANKTNYYLSEPDENGNFKCHKMGEIIITVLDNKDKTPLQGALISLSGAGTFRSNKLSDENGKIVFSGLVSSDYFLRPMMKEYNFEPASQVIKIKEGAFVKVSLHGIRVAHSVYGSVQSLNGEPESKVTVIATGVNNCSQYSEEATSEDNGKFRIRGLHKYCTYKIGIRYEDDGISITRSLPETQEIRIEENDEHDVKLIVIHQVPKMDIVVILKTSNLDNFKNLRVELGLFGVQKPFHTSKIDVSQYKNLKPERHNNPGVLHYLPTVLADNRTYYVRLTSNQQQPPEIAHIYYFVANSTFKSFEIDYSPNFNHQDNLKHTSKWMFVFLIALIVVVYNINQILAFVTDLTKQMYSKFLTTNRRELPSDSPMHTSDIDDLVQNINAPHKRKSKPRRT